AAGLRPSQTKTDEIFAPQRRFLCIKYVIGDLFTAPNQESLAHCVSEDLRMGKGIAVLFKKNFRRVAALKEQKKLVGECAVLTHDRRFIYYLITKKKASQKPAYVSLKQSLEAMKSHCLENNIKRISLPRFNGLDELEWSKVSQILQDVFKQTDISLTVYSLPQATRPKQSMRKVRRSM
uniref:Macro domain-containing protein n=1 Tax=Poecilia latipinna TaxID=48699 RepID=A0A3B3V7N6_9TELE